jgi:hypothetical protein
MHFVPSPFMVGDGNVPIGAILAIANVQAWALPTANEIKNGWALCNGVAFSSLVGQYHPSLTGTRPQLSDGRFLLGSTTIGTTGGSNANVTLSAAHIPAITSGLDSVDHNHSPAGSTVGHDREHTHGGSTSDAGAAHTHTWPTSISGWGGSGMYVSSGAAQACSTSGIQQNHSHSTADTGYSGNNSASHGHNGISFTTAGISANHTHNLGNASPASFSVLPKYLPCVFVMRVI